MRDPRRIDPIIERLRAYWLANPDLRLGQIVVNATPSRDETRTFYCEDHLLSDGIPSVPYEHGDGEILGGFAYDESTQYSRVAARYLCARMSEWSEDRDCGSWTDGVDREIWLVGSGAQPPPEVCLGMDAADALERAQACVAMGRDLGVWWTWSCDASRAGQGGPRRVVLRDWLADQGLADENAP
jgi:hypothetical protein